MERFRKPRWDEEAFKHLFLSHDFNALGFDHSKQRRGMIFSESLRTNQVRLYLRINLTGQVPNLAYYPISCGQLFVMTLNFSKV